MMRMTFGKTIGVKAMTKSVEQETLRDSLRGMIKAADLLVDRAKQKLSVRGDAPSRPGTPPTMHEGMLRDGIGRTRGLVTKGAAGVAWGFGVGAEALARMKAHAARRGETLGEMFAIGNMNEYGSVNYDLARSHPARPFIRPTEEELKHEVVRIVEESYL